MDWLAELRRATGHNECRLPSGLAFSGDAERLTKSLGPRAVSGNVQEDGAAFDAWALTFLAHGCSETVEVRLAELATVIGGGERHYQRLLLTRLELARAPRITGALRDRDPTK